MVFHNDNLFFFDIFNYNNLDSLNVNTFPVSFSYDYFSLKDNKSLYFIKPKIMNFRIFSENQFSNFEKFYLKNEFFVVDGFEYGMINNENIDFFLNSKKYKTQRLNDYKHFFLTRVPIPPVFGKLKKVVEERAEEAVNKNMNTGFNFISKLIFLQIFIGFLIKKKIIEV